MLQTIGVSEIQRGGGTDQLVAAPAIARKSGDVERDGHRDWRHVPPRRRPSSPRYRPHRPKRRKNRSTAGWPVILNEFRKLISDNALLMNFYSFNASPLVTRFGDEPSANREELVVIGAPFFPHKLINGYSSRQGTVVESVNGKPVRSLIHLVTLLRDPKDDLVVIKFDQRFGESVVVPRKELLEATSDILNDNGIRLQGSKDVMDV